MSFSVIFRSKQGFLISRDRIQVQVSLRLSAVMSHILKEFLVWEEKPTTLETNDHFYSCASVTPNLCTASH